MDAQLRDTRGQGPGSAWWGQRHQKMGHPSQPGGVRPNLKQAPTHCLEIWGGRRTWSPWRMGVGEWGVSTRGAIWGEADIRLRCLGLFLGALLRLRAGVQSDLEMAPMREGAGS